SERVEELARRSVDSMAVMGGECDFTRDVAVRFPLEVILSILGLPDTDYDLMLKLTQELAASEDPDLSRGVDEAGTIASVLEMIDYFGKVTVDRREHPTAGLLTVNANAQLPTGPLPDLETFGFYVIIGTAGH